MHKLYSGLDGLDLALKTSASPELIRLLESGKEFSAEHQCDARAVFNGVVIQIGPTGRRGGYAYTFNTGPEGAVWAVKKPKASDPWGVHVSIRSRALALHGLEKVRGDLEKTCNKLGFSVPVDGISIGRVDFAVDILAPEFILDSNAVVVHSRTKLKTHTDLFESQVHSHSGRVTSVTIGKMPGRQVIIYDKREEAMQKHKHEWPLIWQEAVTRLGLPPLDMKQRETSQVWRVELRLGKSALRDRSNIRGWASFYEELEGQMVRLSNDVSLHLPTPDTNRSRWPLHPLWIMAQQVVANGIFAHDVEVPYEAVQAADLAQKQQEFMTLVTSHLVTLAYLDGLKEPDMREFLNVMPSRVKHFLRHHPRDVAQRLSDAADKYGWLMEL